MASVEGSPGTFAVVVHLPPGYHQYKFIVDGEWRHDEAQPYMPDPLGNVNNWLFVRRPDSVPGAPEVLAQQQLLQQQQLQQAQQAAQQQAAQQRAPQLAPSAAAAPQAHPGWGGPDPPAPQQDVDMAQAEGVLPPIAMSDDEPHHSRKKMQEFLHRHTAYELIPESGKVVLLDMDFPVRLAFHALAEQGLSSAPLWDSTQGTITGMVSASDFIHTLVRLRHSVSAGAGPLSEEQMDTHTIRHLREAAAAEQRPLKQLVCCHPSDNLEQVVATLFENQCSTAPILSCAPSGTEEVPTLLHTATVSGVVGTLMRHFRASLASLPLLAQPIQNLPLGTWSPDSRAGEAPGGEGAAPGCLEPREARKVKELHVVHPNTPLTVALVQLLTSGVSCLPVVDEAGTLLDVYARADITSLTRDNAYTRLQFEDLTVGQALQLTQTPPQAPSPHGAAATSGAQDSQAPPPVKQTRVFVCTRQDTLRMVVEKLSVPSARRLVVVEPSTRRVEGIISLSDVACYLFLSDANPASTFQG